MQTYTIDLVKGDNFDPSFVSLVRSWPASPFRFIAAHAYCRGCSEQQRVYPYALYPRKGSDEYDGDHIALGSHQGKAAVRR